MRGGGFAKRIMEEEDVVVVAVAVGAIEIQSR